MGLCGHLSYGVGFTVDINKPNTFDSLYTKQYYADYFDGYKKQYSPEDFCNGNTYFLLVSPNASSYEIYSFSDAEGNLLMTKKEAYHNSQKIAYK